MNPHEQKKIREIQHEIKHNVALYCSDNNQELFRVQRSLDGMSDIKFYIINHLKDFPNSIMHNIFLLQSINEHSTQKQKDENNKILTQFKTKYRSSNFFSLFGQSGFADLDIAVLLGGVGSQHNHEDALYIIKHLVIYAMTNDPKSHEDFLKYVFDYMEKVFSHSTYYKKEKVDEYDKTRSAFYTEIYITLFLLDKKIDTKYTDMLLDRVKDNPKILKKIVKQWKQISCIYPEQYIVDFDDMLGQYICKDENIKQEELQLLTSLAVVCKLIIEGKIKTSDSFITTLPDESKHIMKFEMLRLLRKTSSLLEAHDQLGRYFEHVDSSFEERVRFEDYFLCFQQECTKDNCNELIAFIMKLSTEPDGNINSEKFTNFIAENLNNLLRTGDDSYKHFISALFEAEKTHFDNVELIENKSLIDARSLLKKSKNFISGFFEAEKTHVDNVELIENKSLIDARSLLKTGLYDIHDERLCQELTEYVRDQALINMSGNLHYFNNILKETFEIFQESKDLQKEFINSLQILECNDTTVTVGYSDNKSFNIEKKIIEENKDFPVLLLLNYKLERLQGLDNSQQVIRSLKGDNVDHNDDQFTQAIISHIDALNVENQELGDLKNIENKKLGDLKNVENKKLGDLKNVENKKLGDLKNVENQELDHSYNVQKIKELLFESARAKHHDNNGGKLNQWIQYLTQFLQRKRENLDEYEEYQIAKVNSADQVIKEIIHNIYYNLSALDQKNFLSYVVHYASEAGLIDKSQFLQKHMKSFLGDLALKGARLPNDTCVAMFFYDKNGQIKLNSNNLNYLYQSLLSNNFDILGYLQNKNLIQQNREIAIDNLQDFRNKEGIIYNPMNIIAYTLPDVDKLILKLDEIDLTFVASVFQKSVGKEVKELSPAILEQFMKNVVHNNNLLLKNEAGSKDISSIENRFLVKKLLSITNGLESGGKKSIMGDKEANFNPVQSKPIENILSPKVQDNHSELLSIKNGLESGGKKSIMEDKEANFNPVQSKPIENKPSVSKTHSADGVLSNESKIVQHGKTFDLDKISSLDDLQSLYTTSKTDNIDFNQLVEKIVFNDKIDSSNKEEMFHFIFNNKPNYEYAQRTVALVTANKIKSIIYADASDEPIEKKGHEDILVCINDRCTQRNEDHEELVRAFFHAYGMSQSEHDLNDNDVIMNGLSCYLDDKQDVDIKTAEAQYFVSSLIAYAIATENSELNNKVWKFVNERVKLIDIKTPKLEPRNKNTSKSHDLSNRKKGL